MSYLEAKRARDLALVRALHGAVEGDEEPGANASPTLDGGARGGPTLPHVLLHDGPVPVGPRDEVGWGPEYEIEEGAHLIFPGLIGVDAETD